jgi:2-keto-3-deoxy-L-rhamnonate aldolase RhmA
MQHSLMSYADVAAMLAACPKVGASPILRLPDASEGAVQKAMDMGMLGVVVPTVDDAIMAREAARYTRFPPLARRSLGGGQLFSIWGPEVKQGEDFLETMSDNMLVIVMIETVEGVNNALEIATVPGVDVVMIGNADLSNFSGYAQDSQDYHDLQIKVRNATYRAGKLYGNAAFANFEGNPLSSDSRLHLQGPANDGWDNPNVPGAY